MKKEKSAEFEAKMDRGRAWVMVKALAGDKTTAILITVSDGKEQVSVKPSMYELGQLKSQLEELLDFLVEGTE